MRLRERSHPDDRVQRLKLAFKTGNVWCDEAAEAVEEVHKELAERNLPQRRSPSIVSLILATVVPILALIGAGVAVMGLIRFISSCSAAP